YLRQRKLDQAMASSRQALRINPQLPEGHFNLATAYVEDGQYAEAVAVCRDLLSIRPDYIDAEKILGIVALKEGRLENALASFARVLSQKPNEAEVHFNRAVTWLTQGNYEDGWQEYEWRWRWKDFVVRPFSQQIWDGSSLEGKSILLLAEQGLGDTLQF